MTAHPPQGLEGKSDAMERALRQRIDIMTREFAEERAQWNHDRENYIRDVSMMAEACGVQFDAPEAMADAIRRARREAQEALRAVCAELWLCAAQLGCDWKDKGWRQRSSVGRAYDAAQAALKASPLPVEDKT